MFKKIFLGLASVAMFTACTGDYTDWLDPQSNGAEGDAYFDVTAAAPIEIANVETSTVQAFVPTIKDEVADRTYSFELTLTNEDGTQSEVLAADANGNVSKEELAKATEDFYGKRPTARAIKGTVTTFVVAGEALKSTKEVTVTVTPEAPEIETAYYVTGSINGWDNTDKTYKLTNSGADVYDDPVFTCTIPAEAVTSDVEFKLTPESGLGGDWSKCITAGEEEGKIAYNNAGGNLTFAYDAKAKLYNLSFNMLDMTWSCTPVSYPRFIYYIGATDGWTNAEQKLESPDYDGHYTGYLYCADPNGWGNQFKFQKTAGDWGTEINSGHFTSFSGAAYDAGGNIGVSGGQSVYYFDVDIANGTISATEITTMGIIGDFNGWGGDVVMTWDANDYCFVANNAGVTTNGWKFRINQGWDLNLGGTLDKLVQNGDNLGVAGNTVKLYPTRRNSDNIYCTVQ